MNSSSSVTGGLSIASHCQSGLPKCSIVPSDAIVWSQVKGKVSFIRSLIAVKPDMKIGHISRNGSAAISRATNSSIGQVRVNHNRCWSPRRRYLRSTSAPPMIAP